MAGRQLRLVKKLIFLGFSFLFALVGNFVISRVCLAEPAWQYDGVTICAAANSQNSPWVIPSSNGKNIIVWQDLRNNPDRGIYAQMVDASGIPQWTTDGIAICNVSGSYADYIQVVSDDQNGAMIFWCDWRSGSPALYGQRINSSGAAQWTTSGKYVASNSYSVTGNVEPTIAKDGLGGAIIVYDVQYSGGGNLGQHVQRINSSGVPQWSPAVNGVTVCAAADGYQPTLISDGQGGAIVTWESLGLDYIKARRFSSAGSDLWGYSGVTICSGHSCSAVVSASDNLGGAIFAWTDSRNSNNDIYAQRIDASGLVKWTANGVPVCNTPENQSYPQIVPDGQGGAIVTWRDARGTNSVYAQRIDSTGAPVVPWVANGNVVCNSGSACLFPAYSPCMTSDGQSGAIICWADARNGNKDIYTQRIDSQGNATWLSDGMLTCGAIGDQTINSMNYRSWNNNGICFDGQYGVVIAWNDNRAGSSNTHVFAQHILPMKPAITSTYPSYLILGAIRNISILGSYFSQTTAIKLVKNGQPDIYGMNMNKPNGGQIDANFDLTSAAVGQWTVLAIDSCGQTSNADVLVTISNQTPTPTMTPTATITPTVDVNSFTGTPTRTATATPIPAAATATPTSTPTLSWSEYRPFPDFGGQIIDKNYFFVAPNPTQGVNVNFRFYLRQSAEVEIRIYTPQGSHVLTKPFNFYPQGWNTCIWNASGMANGVYFYIAEAKISSGVREKFKKALALIK